MSAYWPSKPTIDTFSEDLANSIVRCQAFLWYCIIFVIDYHLQNLPSKQLACIRFCWWVFIFFINVYISFFFFSSFREVYSELSTKHIANICSEIFYLLSHNLNIIPDVLLGNIDDITTDHIKLALWVWQAYTSEVREGDKSHNLTGQFVQVKAGCLGTC